MKTNLSNLMTIAVEEERKFSSYGYELKDYAKSTTTQELNGTINVIEDYKEDFKRTLEDYKKSQERITKIKAIIYQKNNQYKLSDGRSIQEAIVDNSTLRKMKAIYETLLAQRNTKRRITEVNNSYFECKTINYDTKQIQKEYDEIIKKIQYTDFEISKLNSIEFDADI